MRKNTSINLMVSPETKTKLLEKSKSLGLSLTTYFEKIASEPVVFLDSNVKTILESLKLKT